MFALNRRATEMPQSKATDAFAIFEDQFKQLFESIHADRRTMQ